MKVLGGIKLNGESEELLEVPHLPFQRQHKKMGVSFTIASVDVLTQVPDNTHTFICHPWIGGTGLKQTLHGGISHWAHYNPSSEAPTPTPNPTMMIIVAFAPSTHY